RQAREGPGRWVPADGGFDVGRISELVGRPDVDVRREPSQRRPQKAEVERVAQQDDARRRMRGRSRYGVDVSRGSERPSDAVSARAGWTMRSNRKPGAAPDRLGQPHAAAVNRRHEDSRQEGLGAPAEQAPGSGPGKPDAPGTVQDAWRMLEACLPFGPWTTSNVTFWPSLSDLNPFACTELKCANRSSPPSSGVMKPNPLASLNHLTVPVAMLIYFLRLKAVAFVIADRGPRANKHP